MGVLHLIYINTRSVNETGRTAPNVQHVRLVIWGALNLMHRLFG